MTTSINQTSVELAARLKSRNIVIATAESCTGGWVSEAITAVSGSSAWFDRGFVTYSNAAKQEMLGVQQSTLEKYGAVSEETAREMASGAIRQSQADVSVSITGIAGPDGGTTEKPVGTVWFAWASQQKTAAVCHVLSGDRQQVRKQAVLIALQGLMEISE